VTAVWVTSGALTVKVLVIMAVGPAPVIVVVLVIVTSFHFVMVVHFGVPLSNWSSVSVMLPAVAPIASAAKIAQALI
jgi:hypothetical protein